MYTREALQDIAKLHGWQGDEETLPLYLPFGTLRAMGGSSPYVIAAEQLTVDVIEPSVWEWLISFESDRAVVDIIMERVYLSNPDSEGSGQDEIGGGQGDGESQQGGAPLGEQENPYAKPTPQEGEGEGDDEGEGEQKQKQKQQGQGQGQGQQSPQPPKPQQGQGQGQPNNKPQPPKPQPQGGQDKQQQQRALNKFLKSLKDRQKKEQEKIARCMQTNSEYDSAGKVSEGSIAIANRLRSYFDQISGAFDMEPTPLWDVKKFVRRLAMRQTIDPARKWEDGRPKMVFLTDTSGSCEDVSSDITLAANSACMLGTPQGEIISIPMGNNWLSQAERGWRNGLPLASMGEEWGEDENGQPKLKRGGEAYRALSERMGQEDRANKAVTVASVKTTLMMAGLDATSAEAIGEAVMASRMRNSTYLPRFALQVLAALELGVKVTPDLAYYRPLHRCRNVELTGVHLDTSAQVHIDNYQRAMNDPHFQGAVRRAQAASVTRLAEHNSPEKLKAYAEETARLTFEMHAAFSHAYHQTPHIASWSALSSDKKQALCGTSAAREANHGIAYAMERVDSLWAGMLADMDAHYYIYYTDSDGSDAITALAPLLKEHQHLYILTYACIPNMKVDDTKSNADPYLSRTGRWASKANNELGYHVAAGRYGTPATVSAQGLTGISVPVAAYSPRNEFDWQWLPTWFNGNGWYLMRMMKGANKVTVIPNVDSVAGALDALRLIASPDKMGRARQTGEKIRSQLDSEGRWTQNMMEGKRISNSLIPVHVSDRGLQDTPFDVK